MIQLVCELSENIIILLTAVGFNLYVNCLVDITRSYVFVFVCFFFYITNCGKQNKLSLFSISVWRKCRVV